jgi:hypothetical protein
VATRPGAAGVAAQLEPQFSAKVQELIEMEEAAGKKGHLDRQEAISTKLDTQVWHCRRVGSPTRVCAPGSV